MAVGTEYAWRSVKMFGGTGRELEIRDEANRNRVLKAISNTLRYLALGNSNAFRSMLVRRTLLYVDSASSG
jgi:hypothetical protein